MGVLHDLLLISVDMKTKPDFYHVGPVNCAVKPKTWNDLPIAPSVAPFYGLDLESYKVIPKRNYFGAYG